MIWALACIADPGAGRPLPHSDTDVDSDDGTAGDTDDDPDTVTGPVRYPFDAVHSPITEFVRDELAAIVARHPRQDDVFMKVGASSLQSQGSLYCFADGPVDLDAFGSLQPSLDHFLGGDAAGTTPFDRPSLAAVSGKTAAWAIDGPMDDEIDAIDPRFALVHYGTNDMGMGSTHLSALSPFHEAMVSLLDSLSEQGIVPLVASISHRGDDPEADAWVPTYNAVLRALAQERQVPFVDWYLALEPLPGHGLSGDGVHVNGYPGGTCVFTGDGLDYGYNVRNLLTLQALDRLKRAVLEGEVLDSTVESFTGSGTAEDPFLMTLPFAHHGDTAATGASILDIYGCDDADESGPELVYRLDIEVSTGFRAVVLDRGDVDVDLHLLQGELSGDACVSRAHEAIEATLSPGTWYLVVDSWVDGDGFERSGAYTLVAHPL